MSETKGKQVNLNTIINAVVLGAVTWVGVSIREGNDRIAKLSERIVVMETLNTEKMQQLTRIEVELAKQRESLRDLQLDVNRIKVSVKL